MTLDLNRARHVAPRLVPATIKMAGSSPARFAFKGEAVPFAARPAPGKSLGPLAGAGVRLTIYVLLILSTVLALLIGVLVYQEQQFSDAISAVLRPSSVSAEASTMKADSVEQIKARQELLKTYQEMANAAREFWAKMAQMILLNLLLPVLTALLGYVFASKPANR